MDELGQKKVREVMRQHGGKALIVAAVILPVLVLGVICLLSSGNMGLGFTQKWNDEGAYYALVKTWLATGQPVGYWGFDGAHAIVGTGSAWSPAIILPYALFGMMFSWNLSSMFYANVTFLCLANVIFFLLIKPQKKHVVRVILIQCVSVISILYLTTGMSEPLRFSLAIILAGIYGKLFWGESSKVFRYIVAPLFIIATVQIYVFMAFSIPIYIFAVMKDSKLWKKLAVSAGALLGVAGISYYILHLISSNYNIAKTERLLEMVRKADLTGMIVTYLRMLKDGLWELISICNPYVGHGIFIWFVLLCVLFIILPLVILINNKDQDKKSSTLIMKKEERIRKGAILQKDKTVLLQISYSVAIFLLMYISVYSLERFTFLRGMGIIIIFSMYLVCQMECKTSFGILFSLYAIGILFLPVNLSDFMEGRFLTETELLARQQLEVQLSEVLIVEEKDENGIKTDPWENTIALYTLEPKVISAIPAGMGINMILTEGADIPSAKYLLFSLTERENLHSEWIEFYYPDVYEQNKDTLDENFEVLFQDEYYIVFTRVKE